jgi:hypothetical protein
MAIKKTIEIDVDSSSAEKDVKKLISSFEELGKDANKSINSIEKGVENTEKATKSLANGFKGVGLAIKAMGIGLVLEAFNILKDLFMSNQVIADKFGAAFKALSIAFNDFFNYINKNADGVVKFFKNIFENPVESLKKFGDLIKENIIERFNSALEVAGFMADALKKLFTGDFQGALKSVKEAGKEMVDVFTGVDDTTGKVGKLVDKTIDYAKATFNAAEALQKQENNAKRAVAIQAGLVEEYDRQAESLRQIRDDDTKTIDERIKANNDLKEVLENQRKAMLAQANLQVQAAANQYNLNKSIENEVALIEARNNVKGVEAQINGFISEQKTNENSLNKEAIDLIKSRNENETELAINRKLFEAERIKDEEQKLLTQKEALKFEQTLEEERLKANILLYKEGTQARVDAENEYALRKQEIEQQIQLKEDEIAEFKRNKAIENQQLLIDNETLSFETRRNALLEQERLLLEDKNLSEEQRNAIEKQYSKARVEIGRLEFEQKMAQANETANVLGNLANLVGKQTAAGKALGIATALINTYVGVSEALKQKSTLPSPYDYVAKAVNVAAILATGFKSVKAITSVKVPGGGGGGGGSAPSMSAAGGGAAGGGAAAPSFNVVGNSGVNQIAQTLGAQQPVQAYVVANNVTTQQALDRNIVRNASIG